jgi:hypothetical protein
MKAGTPAKFVVVMRNAKHSDGRQGDAYIGNDLQFSTLDPSEARAFDEYEAERFRDHWRGWYRGFAGGATIDREAA